MESIKPAYAIKIVGGIAVVLAIVIGLFIVRKLDDRHILLGAWTVGLFDPTTQQLHPEKLVAFENLLQKKMAIAHYYIGWEALENPSFVQQLATLQSHGWTPMVSVNPYFFSQCPATSTALYQAIAQGQCDAFLTSAAKNLSHVNKPFYFVFAWEMNNYQNAWSVSTTGSTDQSYVLAWQHMHTIFAQQNARNVLWVFCPNVPEETNYPYSDLYPGDKYVDAAGLDGYNWGTTQSWSKWESFSAIFSGSYASITKVAPNKPVIIAEVNSTDQGGNKGDWYTDMLTVQMPQHFKNVTAVVFFNEDKTAEQHVNWLVNSNSAALTSLKAAVQTPDY